MNHYFKKQFFIGLVFVLIVVVIGGGIYLIVKPNKPIVNNGNQNQETPESLEILFDNFIKTTENNYDLVARVKNPNSNWGVQSVGYIFELYDSNNQLIFFKEGKTYILPQEAKYIIEQKLYSEKFISKIEFKIKDVSWIKLITFEELELRIKNREQQITEDGFHKLVGAIENKTNYNLDTIEIVGLLFDSDGNVISVGKTEMNTVLMNESRGFEIFWPYQISEAVSSYDIRVYTNVFSNENFLKAHGEPEQEE